MRIKPLLAAVAGALFSASGAQAQIVSSSNGSIYNIPGPITDQVLAHQMGPIKLTATWNGFSEVSYFSHITGNTWGFQSSNLSLTIDGSSDTWYTYWAGYNATSGLKSLQFDADGTNILFDRSFFFNLLEGTAGSNVGYDGDLACDGGVVIQLYCELGTTVHYTNAARYAPDAPVGDVFRMMTISFGGNGLATGRDLDLLRFDTDMISTVPEPSTYAMLATGLLGMLVLQRRRRRGA